MTSTQKTMTPEQAAKWLHSPRNEAKVAENWFLKRMVDTIRRYGSLTEKQAAAVGRTAKPPKSGKNISLKPIFDMLDTASEHKKWPKLHVQVREDGPEYRLHVSRKGKYPGWIQIKDSDLGLWYGRISPEGEHHGSYKADPDGKVREDMEAFSKDPLGIAEQHGRITGNCCFCRRTLDDERSKNLGYGPVCARNHGLTPPY